MVDLMNEKLLIVMVVFVTFCGMLLSFVSSWMSVTRYLSKDLNDLYD